MSLSREQIDAALRHALPDARLRSAEPGAAGELLRLEDGRRLVLRRYEAGAAEPEALRLLAGAIEVPAPQLEAFVAEGGPLGEPYALLAPIEGGTLESALPRMSEQERYSLGLSLGEALARVHAIGIARYGALGGSADAEGMGERAYLLARLEQAIERCGAQLTAATRQNLRRWFEEQVAESGREAVLCHGALDTRNVLVRRAEDGWRLSGIVGWGASVAWRPGWDHALFLEAAAGAEAFGLRVGYGEGYDGLNERTYDQLREHALAPYRLIMHVERAASSPAGAERHIRLVEAMLAALLTRPDDDERFDTALTA